MVRINCLLSCLGCQLLLPFLPKGEKLIGALGSCCATLLVPIGREAPHQNQVFPKETLRQPLGADEYRQEGRESVLCFRRKHLNQQEGMYLKFLKVTLTFVRINEFQSASRKRIRFFFTSLRDACVFTFSVHPVGMRDFWYISSKSARGAILPKGEMAQQQLAILVGSKCFRRKHLEPTTKLLFLISS